MDKDRLERFKNRVDESARAELFDRKLLPAEEEVRKCYEDLAMAFHSSLYADVDADLNLKLASSPRSILPSNQSAKSSDLHTAMMRRSLGFEALTKNLIGFSGSVTRSCS